MATTIFARLDLDAAPLDDPHDDDDHSTTPHADDTTPRHLPLMTPLLGTTTPPLTPSPPRLTASPCSRSSSSSSCAPSSEPMRRSLASIGYSRPPLAAVGMERTPSSQGVDGNPFAGRQSPMLVQRRPSSYSCADTIALDDLATEPSPETSPRPSPLLETQHHTIPLRRRTTPRAFLATQYDTPRTRTRGASAPPLRSQSSPRADTRAGRAYLSLRVQNSLGSIRALPWRQDGP
ncbi:hypothetical protein Q8F55_003784 [Vanrija albida]|uniref:Uncharacterized protein n=1 Tax=Vanrija albida TaxID=181172 RepID=A0ABR3Q5H4_9TREE